MTWRYELRWRERRQTLPGRRRRRRHRRRDIERAHRYEPTPFDTSSASRGVRKRLAWAIVALAVTVGCIMIGGFSVATFAGLFAVTVGVSSLGAAVALLLSARNEERVHDVAGRLDEPGWGEEADGRELPGPGEDGTDGWVADQSGPR